MADKASFSLKDYDKEFSSTSINVADVTGANLDALKTSVGILRVALEAIMLQGFFLIDILDNVYNAFPTVTNGFSQRETKWVFIVKDPLGNVYKGNEVPCADLDILENSSKYIYKNQAVTVVAKATEVQAVVTAFEAIAKDKTGGALIVIDIYQAGRNI